MNSRTIRNIAKSNSDNNRNCGKNQFISRRLLRPLSFNAGTSNGVAALLTVALLIVVSLISCTKEQSNLGLPTSPICKSRTATSGNTDVELKAALKPYVHFELLSAKGEGQLGNEPFVYILPSTFRTDSSAVILTRNIQHSADLLNGDADTDRVHFPYVAYVSDVGFGGVNRQDTWVYVSQRNLMDSTNAIKAWMIQTATTFHSNGIVTDTTKHPATICKIAWDAPELKR